MRERLAKLSSELDVGTRPGGGARLAASIPRQRLSLKEPA
jgi:signal transduction histidine kinase